MKKRIMALLLSLVMALSLVPTTVWAASNSTVVLHPSVNNTVTGVKVEVGDKINGYPITSISGYDITVDLGKYNVNNGTFRLPYAKDIWEGVDNNKVDYISWAGSGSNNRSEGANALLANGKNTAYYYFKGEPVLPTFTLNYDANGGTGAPASQTYKATSQYEGSHTFTISSQQPTRDDYDFQGWSTTPTGAVQYQPNGSIVVTGTTTLYAVWKEKTPPVTAPDDPKLGENFNLNSNVVKFICETTTDHNDSYGLKNGYYSVSDKKQTSSGKWRCAIEIDLNRYFTDFYSKDHPGHTRTKPTGEISRVVYYLDWNENTQTWTIPESSISATEIHVKCDATQPEGPGDTKPTFSEADGRIKVKCVVNPANHDPAEKTYKLSDGTYTDKGSTTDQAGKITYSISLDRNSFIKKFDTDTNKTHTDKETNADTRITWTWNAKEKAWVLDTMTDTVATILCECETSNIPNEPTFDEIFKALNGPVTVTCINRVWKDGNKVMDCGESKYAAKAGIVGQNYTIKQDKNNANAWIVTFPVTNFVKAFKQTPAHDLYSNNTLNWSITWTDKKWTAEPVEPGVDNLVKLTHAPTDWREVNKVTHNGIWTSCENGKTGKCEYGIAVAFAKGDVVSVVPEAGVPGSYIATFKVSTYADTCAKACNDKNFKNSSRTHDLLTQETVQWKLYATDQADEKIGNQVLNHVWAAEPVTKGTDDICNVAHRVKVTFDENYNNASTTEVMYKYNTNEVKEGTFPADPVREGYTFKGWNTKANGKGDVFTDMTVVADDMTVYAQWEANEYTVTFDANADGDKSAKVTPKTKAVTFDAAYGELAKASRAGYTFQGWFTAKEGGTEVKSDDIVKKAGNHTLYAHWEITPHNIYAYLRTGDSSGDVIRLKKSTLDRLGLSAYNKNGFISIGEFLSKTLLARDEYYGFDEDDALVIADVVKELTAKIKLGAVGEKINWSWLYTPADVDDRIDGYLANDKEGYQLSGTLTLYSVMFKTEDSENVKGMPKATYGTFYDYFIEGETITMPANPTRTGYDFKGWAVNGKTVDTTNGYTITGDVVFTAQWEKQTYTVTFDSMGGSKINDQKVKYQETATKPTDPTKSGYTFGGWYTDNKCTKGNEFRFDTKITGDMTLYAKWDVKRTGTNPDAKNPYIKDNTTKTDGKKVESGKTFDAGIAMYVGLSILSVTGSAVVIRKRKDF